MSTTFFVSSRNCGGRFRELYLERLSAQVRPGDAVKTWTAFSLHEKPTTVYLRNELRAQAEDAASGSGFRRLSPFLGHLVDQMLNFRFLSADNLEFIRNVAAQLGHPWDVALVLNRIIAHAREEVRAGRLVLGGFFLQQRNGRKSKA